MAEEAWELMLGYCMNKDGSYGEPTRLPSALSLQQFIVANVEKFYEIRIVDLLDNCTMHIVDRSLIFPQPPNYKRGNRWDSKTQRFITAA